jgi:hypothetical protein
MGGGGGSSNQPTTQNITQSNLPDYIRPYYEGLMERANANLTTPYVPYGYTRNADGQVVRALDAQGNPVDATRIADFTQDQRTVQNNILNQRTPGQFGTGTNVASAVAQRALEQPAYTTGQFNPNTVSYQQQQANQMAAVPNVNYQQQQANRMADVQNVSYQQQQANQMDTAQTDYRPDLEAFKFGPTRDVSAQNVQAQNMQAAQSSYGQGPLEQFRMAGPQQFGQAQAQQYMSPYMQNVVETQKREATRDARRGQVVQDLGAARQGTYGGSRQLLAGLERERNLGTQLGDIQARGSQAAYENAQQQFERDRAAGLTTGQQNLSAALQQQQLGVQTGTQMALANLSNEQQARVNNQAMNFQAQGMNAENALRAALANQGVDVTRAQANLQSQLSTQELGANIGMQTSLANLAASQQANAQNLAARQQTQGLNAQQAMQAQLANQQAGLTTGQANLAAGQQTQGLNAQQAMQAMLANQQAGLTTGQANLAASQQTQGLNAQQAMQAMLANQSAGLEGQRLTEQSRQFGAQQGLANLAQANQSAQTLSNIGTAQAQTDQARYAQQTSTAAQQQALNQQRLDMAYQDFLRQQGYSAEQLQQYSSLLRGVPVTPSSTTSTYAQQPGIGQQLMGGGLAAAGIYNTLRG